MIYRKQVKIIFTTAIILFTYASCSSAPSRPAEIVSVRSTAFTQIELANKKTSMGNYIQALEHLKEARRVAVACDDPNLLILTDIAQSDVSFYLGNPDEARQKMQNALNTAKEENYIELAALCEIYLARFGLLSNPHDKAVAEDARRDINKNIAALKKEKLNAAFGWTVAALAEKELENFPGAETALKKALAVHLSLNYLEAAAYDWYLMASVFSISGNYTKAAAAIKDAILLDRRAENSHGLGMDYLALGNIYHKAGNEQAAKDAYQRSELVFKAARLDDEAKAALKKHLENY
ncbi:MAG: hypothetical protein LBD07_06835 [Spirochaetaceae bacterium]|jgi:tetratricopeptide (TPR) repeat protein|nr:hypothetical protein [Spirochaetaceae bacterium]